MRAGVFSLTCSEASRHLEKDALIEFCTFIWLLLVYENVSASLLRDWMMTRGECTGALASLCLTLGETAPQTRRSLHPPTVTVVSTGRPEVQVSRGCVVAELYSAALGATQSETDIER